MLTTELKRYFPNASVLGFDVETTGLEYDAAITAIALSDGKEAVVLDVRQRDPAAVGEWLRNHVFDRLCVIHNAQFDLPRAYNQFTQAYPAAIFDTQIAEQLLTAGIDVEDGDDDETVTQLSRDLKSTAKRRLGLLLDKDHEIRTGFQLDNEWSQEQIEYACMDARVLIPLYREHRKMLKAEGMEQIAAIEMACVPVFCEMYRRGITVNVDAMRPLIEEARAEANKHEAALVDLLTPFIYWDRMRKQKAEEAKLLEWQQRYAEAEQRFGEEWDFATAYPDKVEPWYWAWGGVKIAGSSKEISAEEIETWYDQKVSRGKDQPAGKARFVKRMLQHWRTQEGNARPAVKVIEINAPINLRSQPQKTAAVGEYVDLYNKTNQTQVVVHDNFRRKTLIAYSAQVPDQIRTELVGPMLAFTKADKLVQMGDSLLALLRPAGEPRLIEEPEEVESHEYDEYGEVVETWKIMVTTTRQEWPQGTLHGGFRQIGTATGRPASVKPNLLNMPATAAFRRCFVAGPGYALVVADFSQMELRELAEFSQDPAMIDALVTGRDLHLETAAAIFNVPLEEVTDTQRKVGKTLNFGVGYGMAKYAMQYQLAGQKIFVSVEQADEYIKAWRKKFREGWAWIENQGKQALKHGYTETLLGRRRYFERWHREMPRDVEGKIRREGANFPIQGGNADVTKLAMILIQEELQPLGGSVVLQVYDEIVSEVPLEHAQRAKEIVIESMTQAAETILTTVPVKVDCVISSTWAEEDNIAA